MANQPRPPTPEEWRLLWEAAAAMPMPPDIQKLAEALVMLEQSAREDHRRNTPAVSWLGGADG